ncbi:hypothetical protein [Gimesia panareensis]|nr:hypothetical protein [Gimesia panareensis]
MIFSKIYCRFRYYNLLTLLFAAGCMLPTTCLQAQSYPIGLDHPLVENTHYQVLYSVVIEGGCEFQDPDRVIVPYSDLQSVATHTVELKGEMKLTRTPQGLQKNIRVQSFKVNEELQSDDFFLELTGKELVIIEQGNRKQFFVNGKKVAGYEQEILTKLFFIDRIGAAGTDVLLGTDTEQQIGGTWKFSQDTIDWADYPASFSEVKDLDLKMGSSGTARLLSAAKVHGIDCLQLHFSEEYSDYMTGCILENLKILDSNLEQTITGSIPKDPALPWRKVELVSQSECTFRPRNDPFNDVSNRQWVTIKATREISPPSN